MPHNNTTNYYAFDSLSQCLTESEMIAIDEALKVSRKMQDVMIATQLYGKLPAVAGYLHQSQARVYNVVKHNCYTSVDSFLASRGALTPSNSYAITYSLPVSRVANAQVYSVFDIFSACEAHDTELQPSFKHYSRNTLTYQSKILRNNDTLPKAEPFIHPEKGGLTTTP